VGKWCGDSVEKRSASEDFEQNDTEVKVEKVGGIRRIKSQKLTPAFYKRGDVLSGNMAQMLLNWALPDRSQLPTSTATFAEL
jgi:hypothetical protein